MFKYIQGLTLTELLIVQLLGLMIVFLMYQHYMKSQSKYINYTEQLKALLEIKSTVAVLENEITRAGFIGCAHLSKDFPIFAANGSKITPYNKLTGQGLNQLSVQHGLIQSASLIYRLIPHQSWQVSNNVRFQARDKILIADCQHAEIVSLQSVRQQHLQQSLIFATPLHFEYQNDVSISLLINTQFGVYDTKRHYPNGKMIKALYQKDHKGITHELLAGVKDLFFSYTLWQQGRWIEQKADQVTDWSQVVGVRIRLELDSLTNPWYFYIPLT